MHSNKANPIIIDSDDDDDDHRQEAWNVQVEDIWKTALYSVPPWNNKINNILQDSIDTVRKNKVFFRMGDKGIGVYASQHIEKGTVITVYTGDYLESAPFVATHTKRLTGCGGYLDGLQTSLRIRDAVNAHGGQAMSTYESILTNRFGECARSVPGFASLMNSCRDDISLCNVGERKSEYNQHLQTLYYYITTKDIHPGTELMWNYAWRKYT